MATFKSESGFGTFFLRISSQHIGFVKFILEGYDNMALVSTVDPKDGSILVRYPMAFHEDLTAIIADLSPLIFGKFITNPLGSSSDQTADGDELLSVWGFHH